MTDYSDWDSFLNAFDKDIETSFENTSYKIVELWKQLVEENFYNYDNKLYERTWESLDSICVLKFSKNTNGQVEIEIGYDVSKIKFYDMSSKGLWNKHQNPEMMPNLIEYGWNNMYQGIRTEHHGAEAYEYLLKYVNSEDFRALFANELRKLGYTLK